MHIKAKKASAQGNRLPRRNSHHPVSYTHLDVYKRQVYGRIRHIQWNPPMAVDDRDVRIVLQRKRQNRRKIDAAQNIAVRQRHKLLIGVAQERTDGTEQLDAAVRI